MYRNKELTFGGPEIYRGGVASIKTKVFFRDLFRGGYLSTIGLSVSVNKADGRFFCQIGGYMASSTNFRNKMGMSAFTDINGMPLPEYTYTINTYFNAVLDQRTLVCFEH